MKRIVSALAGLVAGVVLVLAGLYMWPFAFQQRSEQVLDSFGSDGETESFFLRVLGDSVIGTHGGNFPFKQFPDGVPLLEGGNLAHTFALVTKFRDGPDGEIIAFGTELEILHEDNSFLRGRLMTHTFWTIVVPGRGTVHLYQTENNWRLFKQVMLPMALSGRSFSSEFYGVNTIGPLADHRGLVVGGTGEFADRSGTFIEIGTLTGADPDGTLRGAMELRLNYGPAR